MTLYKNTVKISCYLRNATHNKIKNLAIHQIFANKIVHTIMLLNTELEKFSLHFKRRGHSATVNCYPITDSPAATPWLVSSEQLTGRKQTTTKIT